MLTQLHIKNYAIVDAINLELQKGMTAVTGETGAGKSIMIDALALCLGERADPKAVRGGAERCELSADFFIDKLPSVQSWLSEHDLASDNECILRRVINVDGRSRSYINDHTSTLQQTRELGQLLVNICGQHEQTVLLKRQRQRELLDAYAGLQTELDTLGQHYQHWHSLQTELTQCLQADAQQARQELLNYQVQELTTLALQEGEWTALEMDHKQLANVDELLSHCQQAQALLSDQNGADITSQLQQCLQLLTPLQNVRPALTNTIELINAAIIQAQEASDDLAAQLDQIDADPERLQSIEKRLEQIYDVARKHHVKPDALAQLHEQLSAELKALAGTETRISELREHITAIEKQYLMLAEKISKQRQAAAKKLQTQIAKYLPQLGLPHGQFKVQFTPADKPITAYGLEQIDFMITTNPGQPLQLLSKVASGGELSRIMLAIQVITAQSSSIPVLCFDEVDVGISGGTAEIVGQLLKQLGQTSQVVCITHQAQVAAQADHHWQVSKHVKGKSTHTQIIALDRAAKIQEIARLIGGVKITDATLAHAESMI